MSGFSAVLKLLKSGYRFDDEDRHIYVAELEKCLVTMDVEVASLVKLAFQRVEDGHGGSFPTTPQHQG